MTVIAVKRGNNSFHIACDSEIEWGNLAIPTEVKNTEKDFCKIWKHDNMTCGTAGFLAHSRLFESFCETSHPKGTDLVSMVKFFYKFRKWVDKISGVPYTTDAQRIFIYKDRAFLVFNDINVTEVGEYSAIGTGAPQALVALYLGHSVIDAVDVAKNFSKGVGGSTYHCVHEF